MRQALQAKQIAADQILEYIGTMQLRPVVLSVVVFCAMTTFADADHSPTSPVAPSSSPEMWKAFDDVGQPDASSPTEMERQPVKMENHREAADHEPQLQTASAHGQCLDRIAAMYLASKADTPLPDAMAARDAARTACGSAEEHELLAEAEQKLTRSISHKQAILSAEQRRQELAELKRQAVARRHGDCGELNVMLFIMNLKLGQMDGRRMVGCQMDSPFLQVLHVTRDGWFMVGTGRAEPQAALRAPRDYMSGALLLRKRVKYLGLMRFVMVNGGMMTLPAFKLIGP